MTIARRFSDWWSKFRAPGIEVRESNPLQPVPDFASSVARLYKKNEEGAGEDAASLLTRSRREVTAIVHAHYSFCHPRAVQIRRYYNQGVIGGLFAYRQPEPTERFADQEHQMFFELGRHHGELVRTMISTKSRQAADI
ncbi:hypothetical protein [Agrobacterium tumefaciens]|uniref:hypothetical protein n=1 Tax=Agrobacterium tumefaciens TaxID=358 RepID=UPI0022002134|nr:hypothetical protein FY128_24720 [Agrobacterium tumefaciens]